MPHAWYVTSGTKCKILGQAPTSARPVPLLLPPFLVEILMHFAADPVCGLR